MNYTSTKKLPLKFFLLVAVLAIPFYVLGAFIDLTKYIPIQLPISALIFLCPMLAAIILTNKFGIKGKLKLLLHRIWDFNKIKNISWMLVAFLAIPTLMFLTYILMTFFHYDIPKPHLKLFDTIVFAILFFIGAIGEEVGWTGFVTDPLQERFGALNAALIIGIVWAVWHIIPYIQTYRTASWIFWQCIGTVAIRIIMVWIYNNTNKSLFAVIVCHTTINMSEYLFPNNGSHYDPFYFAVFLIVAVMMIIYLWGSTTLAHYRFAKK